MIFVLSPRNYCSHPRVGGVKIQIFMFFIYYQLTPYVVPISKVMSHKTHTKNRDPTKYTHILKNIF